LFLQTENLSKPAGTDFFLHCQMSKNVAIIGSGFLGMTIALRLAESGVSVTLFESSDRIGGLASSWRIGDFEWDKHYHVTLASDASTRQIVDELGLADEFRWVETKTGFYTDGKLYSMSDTMEFLKFPPLGIIDKLRLGATIFYASRQKNWQALEKIPVEKWLTSLSGKRTFEKIWKPLLLAKLGEAYKRTSAAFIWATIQRMYAARRSGLKKEMFGYVCGGYARVLERFSEVLMEKGVEIRLNSTVDHIESLAGNRIRVVARSSRRRDDAKTVILQNALRKLDETKYAPLRTAVSVAPGFSGLFLSEPRSRNVSANYVGRSSSGQVFDQVILTCPSKIASAILPQLTTLEHSRLRDVEYQGIICASVLMKCALSQFYVTNITDPVPFTGIIEMTALVGSRAFGNNSLIYLPKYVASDDELFEKTDDEIKGVFLEALEQMYPNFRIKDVLAFKVSRVRNVFPIPAIGYSEKAPESTTSIENVFIVNSSQIVNGTLNVNETIQLAERFADQLLQT
jgi:protoporphyrinogen oxidase